VFSGGSYEDVARWLHNFLTSHAKRENPRIEVEMDAERESDYVATLRLGERRSRPVQLTYREVADDRGTLAWCTALARDTRALAADLIASRDPAEAGRR
jgi:hypothetical protein